MTERTPPVPAHPTTDELADWHGGVLDDSAAAAEIAAHVSACPECAAEVAALDAVAAVLADEGFPVAMPDAVAADLDAALARVSLERAYDVSSLDERRAAGSASADGGSAARRRRFSPAVGWMAGAAAVVVIAGLGYEALSSGPTSQTTSSAESNAPAQGIGPSAADNGGGSAQVPTSSPGGSAGSGTSKRSSAFGYAVVPPRPVTSQDVAAYARHLAAARSPVMFMAASPVRFAHVCSVPKPTKGHLVARVRWNDSRAYLDVNRGARVVTVYSCGSPPQELFSTPY